MLTGPTAVHNGCLKGILFDLDGVIYNAETPIPGAADAVQWARKSGIPFLFVTNTSSRGRDALVEKLRAFGVPCKLDDILSPPAAAAQWLRREGSGPAALFVRDRTKPEFDGVTLVDDVAETGARYVVVGDMGDLWDFPTLNRAFRLLHSTPGSELIALGLTRYWLALDGLRLDTAPYVAALECATGKKARVFGKPGIEFFQAAGAKLGLGMGDLVMVGDDLVTDIQGAQASGLKGVLVRTGKFRDNVDPQGPDAVIDSVANLPALWPRLSDESER